MLICDLCRKKAEIFDSIVLYSRRVDYCKQCRHKAKKLRYFMDKKINEIIRRNKIEVDKEIKAIEVVIINRVKRLGK